MATSPLLTSMGELLEAGWEVLPLPTQAKHAPPTGSTGAEGIALTEEEILEAAFAEGVGNVGLRMPVGVVGLDFDLYKDASTLARLQRELGELPETAAITSRGVESGFTALYSTGGIEVPMVSVATGGVDIIQRSHRYAVAPPSIHPTGSAYRWVEWIGGATLPWTPEISSLSDLPTPWIEYLKSKDKVKYESSDSQVNLGGASCSTMRTLMTKAVEEIRTTGARHDSMVRTVWAVVSASGTGHTGGDYALKVLRREWTRRFSDSETTSRNLDVEWSSSLTGALRKAPIRGSGCSCGQRKITSTIPKSKWALGN